MYQLKLIMIGFIGTFMLTTIGTNVAQADNENEDEILKNLFESFLPTEFLEQSVKADGQDKMGADAKQSARVNDDELVKKTKLVLKGLDNIITGWNSPDNGNCQYTCPNGANPQHKVGFKPTSNGCGTEGMKVDITNLPGITDCCNLHDICYGTCNSGQAACDRQFNACMADACQKMRDHGLIADQNRFIECMATGAAFHLASVSLGCEFYRDSQRAACDCGRTGKGRGRGKDGKIGKEDGTDGAQERIHRYNQEKRTRERSHGSESDSQGDGADPVDFTSSLFDLPDPTDRQEL